MPRNTRKQATRVHRNVDDRAEGRNDDRGKRKTRLTEMHSRILIFISSHASVPTPAWLPPSRPTGGGNYDSFSLWASPLLSQQVHTFVIHCKTSLTGASAESAYSGSLSRPSNLAFDVQKIPSSSSSCMRMRKF